MSSLILFGFLGVRDGQRRTTTKKIRDRKEVKSTHTFYSTAIHGSVQGSSTPAELRVWTPSSDFIYPDNTIMFVIAKAFVLAERPILLESIYIGNFPGNPTAPGYPDGVPEVNGGPFIIASGQIISVPDARPTVLKTFTVAASDYVRDETRFSQFQCVYVKISCYDRLL
jgi:hypothetical protein